MKKVTLLLAFIVFTGTAHAGGSVKANLTIGGYAFPSSRVKALQYATIKEGYHKGCIAKLEGIPISGRVFFEIKEVDCSGNVFAVSGKAIEGGGIEGVTTTTEIIAGREMLTFEKGKEILLVFN